jgi:hypothetical protein
MAISFLRTPFKRLVAFFKIEVSFLQCTHQDAKNSTRTTSDLLPPGWEKRPISRRCAQKELIVNNPKNTYGLHLWLHRTNHTSEFKSENHTSEFKSEINSQVRSIMLTSPWTEPSRLWPPSLPAQTSPILSAARKTINQAIKKQISGRLGKSVRMEEVALTVVVGG